MPSEELADNIINSFALIMSQIAAQRNQQVFEFQTFLVSLIIHNQYISAGYNKSIYKSQIWNYNIWIFPVHQQSLNHWSLFLKYKMTTNKESSQKD